MNKLYIICLLFLCINVNAQDYKTHLEKHRQEYKEAFLQEDRSPIKVDDVKFIQFYDADETYVLNAKFSPAIDAKEFDMATYSGVTKKYVKYGTLYFSINKISHQLTVYQSISLMKNPEYSDYLFIPFKDFTNGVETYGGGRYLDYRTGDIVNNVMKLDFNKAYNPYCAYSDGYSCPIPPEENHVKTEIKAGEKKFGKEH